MPRQLPGGRRCVCGHDKTLHAYTATGLGACLRCYSEMTDGRLLTHCRRFFTVGQRRHLRRLGEHEAAVAQARREHSEAIARKDSQEG